MVGMPILVMIVVTAALAGPSATGSDGISDGIQALVWPLVQPEPVTTMLTQPVYVTHAGDGSGRLFVVEKPGLIRVIRNDQLLSAPFLDIRDRVGSSGGEQGLLSVAFPPGYGSSRFHFYVYYTSVENGQTVVSRFQVSADPDQADAASEEILLTQSQPFSNHNGGQLAFGPLDGYLYIGLGDGGSGGDPQNNAQDVGVLLGKILRIDVESGDVPYGIPATNPLVDTPGARPEIWAFGLRNPWRFSFDRQRGDLYIGDVGQNLYEEIDFQPAASAGGQNYGWRIMEGFHCYNPADCDPTGLVLPVWEYSHDLGCSVTGGMVYRGNRTSAARGIYFYGDYCSGLIWGLIRDGGEWSNHLLLESGLRISSFGEDESGEIYVASLDGRLYRLNLTVEDCYDAMVAPPQLLETQNTEGRGARLDGYSCVNWAAGGEEMIYQVTLSTAGRLMATLDSIQVNRDPDLYLLTDCAEPASCIGFGDNEMIFGRLAAGVYYIVVDNGAAPGYSVGFSLELDGGAPLVFGDYSGDGQVTADDAAVLADWLTEGRRSVGIDPLAADLNRDGRNNLLDLVVLRGYLAGKVDRLPLWDMK